MLFEHRLLAKALFRPDCDLDALLDQLVARAEKRTDSDRTVPTHAAAIAPNSRSKNRRFSTLRLAAGGVPISLKRIP